MSHRPATKHSSGLKGRAKPLKNLKLPKAIFVLLFAIAGVSLLTLTRAATDVVSVKSGAWSDPSVWGGRVPDANSVAIISAGHTVTFDASTVRVSGMKVNAGAVLAFDPGRSGTLESTANVIVEGELGMKPANATTKHTLRFVGIDETKFVGGGMNPLDSDVGLWVMGNGLLDTIGTDKTDWTNATSSIANGTNSVTVSAATGWLVGDQITIAPTEAPSVGDASWKGFDDATITAISGNTLTLNRAMSRPHPRVNGTWDAEVMNLTRNVKIEGTASGRSHIFIRSTKPQTIKNLEVRYMGPRQFKGETWYPGGTPTQVLEPVLGRYGLHFHHNRDASQGSLVEGTVVHDTGSHAFVAHMSNGVTFRDTVSYNTFFDAYWWDPPTTAYPIDPDNFTHDTLYDHAIAGKVQFDPEHRGTRYGAFALGTGLRNTVRNSVAIGVQGNVDAAGFEWPQVHGIDIDPAYPSCICSNSWLFDNNLAHNNKRHGGFSWQVNSNNHIVNRLTAYHNGGSGFMWGSYSNAYRFIENTYYGNAETQFFAWSKSTPIDDNSPSSGFHLVNSTLDAGGQSDYALIVNGRGVVDLHDNNPNPGGVIMGNTFSGGRKAGVSFEFDLHDFGPFVNNTLLSNNIWTNPDQSKDFYVGGAPTTNNSPEEVGNSHLSILRVQDSRHGNLEIRRNDQPGVLNTAWNARVTTLAPGDTLRPLVSLTYPGFGDDKLAGGYRVNGIVDIKAFAADNAAVSKVEFLVDGAKKGEDATTPYSFAWNTAGLTQGSTHTILAKAYDVNGLWDVHETKVVIDSAATTLPPSPSPTPTPTPPAPAPTPPPTPTCIAEDINCDGRVNVFDYSLLIAKYGQTGSNLGRADINQDGRVNVFDFSLLIAKFGT
jgi:hypothetical protein